MSMALKRLKKKLPKDGIDREYGDYPIFISAVNTLWARNTDPNVTYGDFYLAQLEIKYPEAAELLRNSRWNPAGQTRFAINVHDLVGGYFGRKHYFDSGAFALGGTPGGWRKHAHTGLELEPDKYGPTEYDPDSFIPTYKDLPGDQIF